MTNISGIVKSIRKIMRQDKGTGSDELRILQLGWMLFLKIFSDKDKELELIDDDYVSPIPSELHWDQWAGNDEGMTGDELLEFVDRKLFPTLAQLDLSTGNKRALLVHEVFEDNYNYMKSGIHLRQVINKLNEIDFNNSKDKHVFGQIYETFLSELQSAGTLGEFYTPRAITELLTELTDPEHGEKVLDPSCGTGGFLTAAIEHLKDKSSSVEERSAIQENVTGWEYKPLPYLLANTNLILHDINLPDIQYGDSLSKPLSEYTRKHRVDVILANPPFGGVVSNNNENNFPQNYRTKESADLFLTLMIHLLKDGGRAAIVLPDGSLTGDGVKQRIRQKLLEDCNLHTIIRLPNSVFQPYAAVATNLLFFEKGAKTEKVWFYEHKLPVGYKAYSKTKPIQLSEFIDLKQWWNNRVENDHAWCVSMEDIKRNGYDLDIKNPTIVEDQYDCPKALHAAYLKSEEKIQELLQDLTILAINNQAVKNILERNYAVIKNANFRKSLKKSILREAVYGNLTKTWRQKNEPHENAVDLLSKIQKEHEDIYVSKKIRRAKKLKNIESDEVSRALPESWAWCRLGQIVIMQYGKALSKSQTLSSGNYEVYASNGLVGYYDEGLTDKAAIIIGRKGSAGAIQSTQNPSWTTDVAFYIEQSEHINFEYLIYLLRSLELEKLGKGIKPGLNRNEAYSLPVALAPANEQIEIVNVLEHVHDVFEKIESEIEVNKELECQMMESALRSESTIVKKCA